MISSVGSPDANKKDSPLNLLFDDESLESYNIYMSEKVSDSISPYKQQRELHDAQKLIFDEPKQDDSPKSDEPKMMTGGKEKPEPNAKASSSFDFVRKKYILRFVKHWSFNGLILLIILANTVIMSLADYTNVDSNNNLLEDGSIRNIVLIRTELFFVIVFTLEMILKMLAHGVRGSSSSYFSDKWNWLDFLIVLFSIFSYFSDAASVRILRTFRILRPLKSLQALPGVAEITDVLLKSLPKMRDSFMIILFMTFLLSVFGLQLFVGPYTHTRCRMTPFPVKRSWDATAASSMTSLAAFEEYRCLNASNFDYIGQTPSYSKSSSPWSVPHSECYWPVDPDDFRQCTLVGNGNHVCQNGNSYSTNVSEWRWCGSGYDGAGNERFGGNATFLDTYYSSAGYGWINYDNIGFCILQVIQIISGDSWTILEFQLSDAISFQAGALYCNIIVLVMTFFVMRIVVAVLESTFAQKLEMQRRAAKRKRMLFSRTVKLLQHKGNSSLGDEGNMSPSGAAESSSHSNYSPQDNSSYRRVDSTDFEPCQPLEQTHGEGIDNVRSLSINGYDPESPILDTDTKDLPHSRERLLGDSQMSLQIDSSNDSPNKPPLAKADSSEPGVVVPKASNYLRIISEFIDRYDQPDKFYLRRCAKQLEKTIPFRAFFVFLILVNTALFAVDHYPIDDTTANVIDSISFLLTVLFAFEECVILLGCGIKFIFRDFLSSFDLFIVVVSIADIFVNPLPNVLLNKPISSPMSSGSTTGSFTALRAFRLLRLLKLIKSKSFRKLLDKIFMVVFKLSDYLVLFVLLSVVLGLLGMQFFSNQFRFDSNGFVITKINSPEWIAAPDRPRSNFDNFTLSLLTVFQCITVDNWSTVMFNSYRALGPAAILFPIFCFLFGSIVLVNLFLALLIRCFEEDREESREEEEGDEDRPEEFKDIILNSCPKFMSTALQYCGIVWTRAYKCVRDLYMTCVQRASTSSDVSEENWEQFIEQSLAFRAKIAEILETKLFEVAVIAVIILSCVVLALDTPLNDPSSSKATTLFILDIFIIVVFGVEMILKILAFGAFGKPSSYFSDNWNVLDCFVVIVSVLNLSLQQFDSAIVGSLRILRILRPLRLIRRISSLRVVVMSLISSATEILNVFIFTFLVFFIFSAFFTSFLKGQLRACDGDVFQSMISTNATYLNLLTYPQSWQDMSAQERMLFGQNSPLLQLTSSYNASSPSYLSQCNSLGNCCPNWSQLDASTAPTSRQICECWGAGWYPTTDFRFDNVAMSLVTLFDDATIDNWSDNMHAVTDSRGIDMQPVRDHMLHWCYIFFVFIVLSNFFCLHLFIGTITSNFLEAQRRLGGLAAMTEEQEKWVLTLKIIRAIKPLRQPQCPESKIFAIFFRIAESILFTNLVYACIFLQSLTLSIKSFGQSDGTTVRLLFIEVSLVIFFAVEMVIKVCGYTFVVYFQDWWNRLDFVIVACSIASLIQFAVVGDKTGLAITVVRLLRVVRILRLLKRLKFFQNFLDTIILTLPSIWNVSLLLFMVIFIFTVFCMQLFGKVAYNGSYYDNANFRSFGISFITLFRMLTGDNWGQLMYDISKKTPGCVHDPKYDSAYCGFNNSPNCLPLNGCGSVAVFPIMILFIIVTTLIILSVYISVIISNYSSLTMAPIHPQNFELFAEYWADFDPDATCYIDYAMLYPLVFILPAPLGFDRQVFTRRQYARRVGDIKVTKDRKVYFSDVLNILSRSYFHRSFADKKHDFNLENHNFKRRRSKWSSKLRLSRPSSPENIAANTLIPLPPHEVAEDKDGTTVTVILAAEMIAEVWSIRKKCLRGFRNGGLSKDASMSQSIRSLLLKKDKEAHKGKLTMNNDVINAIQRAERKAYAHQLAKESNSIRHVARSVVGIVSSKARSGYTILHQMSSRSSDMSFRVDKANHFEIDSSSNSNEEEGGHFKLNRSNTDDSIINSTAAGEQVNGISQPESVHLKATSSNSLDAVNAKDRANFDLDNVI